MAYNVPVPTRSGAQKGDVALIAPIVVYIPNEIVPGLAFVLVAVAFHGALKRFAGSFLDEAGKAFWSACARRLIARRTRRQQRDATKRRAK